MGKLYLITADRIDIFLYLIDLEMVFISRETMQQQMSENNAFYIA